MKHISMVQKTMLGRSTIWSYYNHNTHITLGTSNKNDMFQIDQNKTRICRMFLLFLIQTISNNVACTASGLKLQLIRYPNINVFNTSRCAIFVHVNKTWKINNCGKSALVHRDWNFKKKNNAKAEKRVLNKRT